MESLRELLNNLSVSIRRGLTLVTNALSHWFSRVGRVEHLPISSRHLVRAIGRFRDSDDDKDILGPNHNQDQPILKLMEDSDEQSSDD